MKHLLSLYKRYFFILLILLAAKRGFGQGGDSKMAEVDFRGMKSWKEVVNVAKAEHKAIFVDCYATWCGPCKYMDTHTYKDSTVATFYNGHFISIKVQCDTGKSDDEYIKSWYANAKEIIQKYKVYKYPCFVFFSPEGEPLNIGFGAMSPENFVSLGGDALNPKRQYFTLLRGYQAGNLDTSSCQYLVQTSEEMGEHEIARAIARKYIDSLWLRLPAEAMWTRNGIHFLIYCFWKKFIGSSDEAFQLFYKNQAKINEVIGDPKCARKYIDYVISVEYVDPALAQTPGTPMLEPQWKHMETAIAKNFNDSIAEKVIVFAKDRWYSYTKNWMALCVNKGVILSRYEDDVNDFDLNSQAWAIFLGCSDKRVLDSAIKWSARVLQDTARLTDSNFPNYIDTYASLLYKVGRINDALYWEEQACRREPINQEFRDRLQTMKLRKLTWKNG